MEPQQVDQWDLVIKVKYGDTLRRIGAYVHGQLMDHNMSKLRAKIISLFKFSHDADFILTYTDEDGDTVTLDDDDELRDAVIGQHLNPLRINVQLKSTDNTDARSETSSPATSPQPGILPVVDDQPKFTPEPLLGVVSNLVSIAEKAIATSPAIAQKIDGVMHSEPFRSAMANLSKDVKKAFPALAEVLEQISNLGLSNASQTSGSTGEAFGGSSVVSTHQMALDVADEPKASTGLIVETMELPSYKSSSVKQNTSAKQSSGVTVPSVDLNKDAPKDATASMYPFEDLLASMWTGTTCSEHGKEVGNSNLDGVSVAAASTAFPPVNQAPRSENFWTSVQLYPTYIDGSADIMGGGSSNKQSPTKAHAASPSQTGFNSRSEVPISRQVGAAPLDVFPTPWGCPMLHPYRRSHIYNENTSRTFHRGVQCDGCGMHPIVGPRFKSNVKEDYDLCNICFTQMGNETDYTRIDRSPHRAPHNHSRCRFPSSNVLHGFGVRRPARAKLESRFIQDVTILDGTVMPPSTHFTKIWRLRNNGTLAWPFGTQLVWVGGDQFGDRVSTNLEIPVNGFPIDKELNVAVDFTAPSRPGRYVSYWRMASPSGQKFGQRVWVLIQVDYSRPNSSAASSFHDLNLNLPPESSGPNGSGIIDVNAEPLDNGFHETNVTPDINVTDTTAGLVEPVENAPNRLVEQSAQLDGGLLVNACNDELSQFNPEDTVTPGASHPLIDLHATPSASDASLVAAAVADRNPVEQTRLKELEDMGFKQIDLNKEVLMLNEYDLEQSVDDLCGFADWDPLLSELQEMGFPDKELNEKLLRKNGGSIKRVVLDLIAGKMVE